MKHGAFGVCSFNNCTTASTLKAKRTCYRHSGHSGHSSETVCKTKGCSSLTAARGACYKHGAQGTCQFDGCTTNAYSRGSPYCRKHGGGKKNPCSVSRCTTIPAARVSASSMAAAEVNVGSQAAPTSWSADSRPARRMVERVTAHFQIAGQLQTKQLATV